MSPRRAPLIRRRIAISFAALGASLFLLAPIDARAVGPTLPPLPWNSPTPTPSPTPKPTSSSTPKTKPKPKPSSAPKPASSPTPAPSSSPAFYANGPAPTPYTGPLSGIHFVLDTVHTARNTQHLLDLLQGLQPGRPLSQEDLARGFGHFPVLGYVWYQQDFGAPRYTPYLSLHEGNDLFAVVGTPISACVDGVISKVANGSIGGISLWLSGDDGVVYYYGHMSGYMPGVAPGLRVHTGDIVGFVGDSGNAKGTYPHLHFEMHPGGGPAVSPKEVLDAWLNEAVANAVDAYQRTIDNNTFNRIGAARWNSLFDLLAEPATPAFQWWPVALDPSASSFGVDLAFDDIAWSLDPQRLAAASGLKDETVKPVIDLAVLDRLLPAPAGPFLAGPIAAAR